MAPSVGNAIRNWRSAILGAITILIIANPLVGAFAQSGVLDPAFNPTISAAPGVVPTVRALAAGNKIVIGGSFTNVNNKPWNCLAVLTSSGALDTSFSNHSAYIGPNSDVRAVAINGFGYYIVSGLFNTPPGTQPFLTRLSFTGVWDTAFAFGTSGPNGSVDVITVNIADNSVLIGGAFTLPRNKVARILDSGSVDLLFNPGTNFSNPVRALVRQSNGKILAGSLNRLLRLNADGTQDTSFDTGTGPNGEVYGIALQTDGKVLVGGGFTDFNGIHSPYLVRLSATGAVDGTFDTQGGPDNWVKNIVVQPDGRIVASGEFAHFAGESRLRIVRLLPSGALDSAFNAEAGADDSVLSLAREFQSGLLYFGGAFTTVNGKPRQSLARIGSVDLKITGLQMQSNGVAKVTLSGQPSLGFVLEGSADLQSWGVVGTGGAFSTFTVQDTQSVSFPHRFYRSHSR